MTLLYKKLREVDGSLPNPVRRFFRYADGAAIQRRTDYHPDWERFLAETQNETINIDEADPIPPSIAELADTALASVNWVAWKNRIATARTAITEMGNDTTGIPNATTRNRFVALHTGQVDAIEAIGKMLHQILDALSKTNDITPM